MRIDNKTDIGKVRETFQSSAQDIIFNKSTQILEYAGDLDIIGRFIKELSESFLHLECNSKKCVWLSMNTKQNTRLLIEIISQN